ncbi:hypothetical protein NP493_354g03043 [Ridgeia piscesae]|uniref:Uncharacterized protein n=1 Tax=Ridgeia piscesae TaxID=27915 RepID=A0AAD9L3J7_RIDPI|nr:hypothetical protein NP493_354g03043 [Ridgeia piscesae]
MRMSNESKFSTKLFSVAIPVITCTTSGVDTTASSAGEDAIVHNPLLATPAIVGEYFGNECTVHGVALSRRLLRGRASSRAQPRRRTLPVPLP